MTPLVRRVGPSPAVQPVDVDELELLVRGEHGSPHSILGPHPHDGGVTVRAFKPLAKRVTVRHGDGTSYELAHEHEGIWVGVLPGADVPDYRLEVTYDDGHPHVVDDPYRFLPTLGEMDLHLVNEGRHELLWTVLGARVHHYDTPFGDTITGTSFAVWAPAARAVRLKADFNSWDGREHPMRAARALRRLGAVRARGRLRQRLQVRRARRRRPVAREGRPDGRATPRCRRTPRRRCSSRPTSGATPTGWTARPAKQHVHEPMSVYELHLASWRRGQDAGSSSPTSCPATSPTSASPTSS